MKHALIACTPFLRCLLLVGWIGGTAALPAQPGLLDPAFDPASGVGALVYSVAVQSDGRILMGGRFTTVNGVGRTNLARLNRDGSLDTTFDLGAGIGSGLSAAVNAVAVDPQGRILVGGDFTDAGGLARTNLVCLNPNGSVDPNFFAGAGTDFAVNSVVVQSDGNVLLAGFFARVSGTERNAIARLYADGTLDTGFDPGTGADAVIYSVALQADGKVVVGGGFTSFDDIERPGIARLLGGTTLKAPRLLNPARSGYGFHD